MQWAQCWGRSWIPPWTKLLKGPVVMSANGHVLPRGRKLLDHIITMQVWDFQESASEPKHPQLPKPLVGSRAPGRTGKSSKVMAGVRGPHVVHSRLLWGVVSHRVYTAAIFSETKFLPQVLLLPTCSKCRRPAVVRSSYSCVWNYSIIPLLSSNFVYSFKGNTYWFHYLSLVLRKSLSASHTWVNLNAPAEPHLMENISGPFPSQFPWEWMSAQY